MKIDDLVYVAQSPIHGRGLFAKVRIPKGTYIGTYEGPEARRNGKYVLWIEDENGLVGRRGMNNLRYLNHCDRPNAEFDGFELYAVKTIKAQQEITINYDGA